MRVELKDVSKRFGQAVALRGVSLVLEPGRKVGLIGPNGSGKSTLLRILLGLLSCEGEVLLDGRSPLTQRAAVAQAMAYVPQVAPQLQAPVAEVVTAVAGLRGLTMTDVAEEAARLALDVPALLARPFRALSGGMKQKLLIALALCALRRGATLLVMDEPTASLDESARARLAELLREEAGGATLLLCSHRIEEVAPLVQDVVAMADGQIAYRGPVAQYLEEHHG